VALGRPQDALTAFNKALGIDPGFTDAQVNKKNTIGKQQIVNISGTITPEVSVSRIGTLLTTVIPTSSLSAAFTTKANETPAEGTVKTTITVSKKTTYSPASPVTVLGALAGAVGVIVVMRRNKQ
jgi:hypothetical protein